MIHRLRTPFLMAAVALGLNASSPRASADTVNLVFEGLSNAPAISLSVGGVSPGAALIPGPYYFTQNQVPPNSSFPSPTVGFCANVFEGMTVGNPITFTSTPLNALPASLSQAQVNYITQLWGLYYQTAWNNPSFASNPINSPAYANSIAFQLALWALIYDGTTMPSGGWLASGNLVVPAPTTGTVYDAGYAQAISDLDSLNGNTSAFTNNFPGETLVYLTAPTSSSSNGGKTDPGQDQITMVPGPSPVPAPAGVVLAGIGMLFLGGRSLRRKMA